MYVSYVERDPDDDELSGAVVERATLELTGVGRRADGTRETLWEQTPKVTGNGHYGHRVAVAPDGYLYITSGERQKFTPAQNMDMNLGKIVRLNPDGSAPEDNPFFGEGPVADQVWTLGHRNPLGIDFDADGQLWVHEMGPKGGDELNRIVRSENYGYPEVSQGGGGGALLRRADPGPRDQPDLREPGAGLGAGDQPGGLRDLRRRRVPGVGRRRAHRRAVLAGADPRRVRAGAGRQPRPAAGGRRDRDGRRARPSATSGAAACARSSRARTGRCTCSRTARAGG